MTTGDIVLWGAILGGSVCNFFARRPPYGVVAAPGYHNTNHVYYGRHQHFPMLSGSVFMAVTGLGDTPVIFSPWVSPMVM